MAGVKSTVKRFGGRDCAHYSRLQIPTRQILEPQQHVERSREGVAELVPPGISSSNG